MRMLSLGVAIVSAAALRTPAWDDLRARDTGASDDRNHRQAGISSNAVVNFAS